MDAEVGATFEYVIRSSGGGETVSGSGTIDSLNQAVSGVALTGINKGLLELNVRLVDALGNVGLVARDTVMFLPPDTRWTGSGWSDGAPDASKSIRIETDGQISGDYTDKAQLLLGESFTAGNDYGYDASKMFGNQSLSLSFVTAGLGDQMILALPLEEAYSLPISISSASETVVEITDASIFDNYSVVLVDRATGERWNLEAGAVTLAGVSEESSNYYLEVISKAQVLGNLSPVENQLGMTFTTKGFELNNLERGNATIQVMDITGRVFLRKEATVEANWRGNWTLPSDKVFIVTITNNDHKLINKVVFK